MSLKNDVSQKKLSEQIQSMWIPRQRMKKTACQWKSPLQKKLSIDYLPREIQSLVLWWKKIEA